MEFGIAVRDLPRATRILFKIVGRTLTRRKGPPPPSGPSSGVGLGWVAATLFDFKGCLDPHLDSLQFFPGDTQVPYPRPSPDRALTW